MAPQKQTANQVGSGFRHAKPIVPVLITSLLTVIYGSICVFLFDGRAIDRIPLDTFSWSFVMFVPYGIGVITVTRKSALRRFRRSGKEDDVAQSLNDINLVEALFVPWLGVLYVVAISLVASLGFLLCFVISVPIVFPAASLGGLTIWLLQQHKNAATIVLLLAIIAPFGLSSVEAHIEKDRETVHTLTSIHIQADAETVWAEIGRVEPILEEEHRFNWTHYVGIPRPVEAILSYPGVGGVREGYFENGLRFEEKIVEWEEYKQMSFEVTEASDSLLPKPLDVIDGETFDIVAGMYEIEALDDGSVMLHFTSEHFLSTRFNRYGARWTDLLMRNLQDYILQIVKERAETSYAADGDV